MYAIKYHLFFSFILFIKPEKRVFVHPFFTNLVLFFIFSKNNYIKYKKANQ